MANKRQLKKRIQQICGEAAVEVLISLPADVARKSVLKLATLQSKSLSNISFDFDRARRDYDSGREYNKAKRLYTKAAFKRLSEDFNKELSEIVKEINATLTTEERNANKLAASNN